MTKAKTKRADSAPPPSLTQWAAGVARPAQVLERAPQRGAVRLPPLDVAALPVRHDVPMVQRRPVVSRYAELFDRLTPGAMVELPTAYRSTICKAVRRRLTSQPGQRFAMRRIDKDRFGLWRTA